MAHLPWKASLFKTKATNLKGPEKNKVLILGELFFCQTRREEEA